MVQSLQLGGHPTNQQPNIRRINRLPVVVAIVLVLLFLGVIFYGLSSRGLYFRGDPDIGGPGGNPASTFGDELKRGVPDGIIGEPTPAPVFQPTPPEPVETETRIRLFQKKGCGKRFPRRKFSQTFSDVPLLLRPPDAYRRDPFFRGARLAFLLRKGDSTEFRPHR